MTDNLLEISFNAGNAAAEERIQSRLFLSASTASMSTAKTVEEAAKPLAEFQLCSVDRERLD